MLWRDEVGANGDSDEIADCIVEMRDCLGDTYDAFGTPTDTLITKIMLGTVACSPACDRYFIAGFKAEGYSFSYFNRQFVLRTLKFCRENLAVLRRAQVKIKESVGTQYPLMKLVDMYFFQTGCEQST